MTSQNPSEAPRGQVRHPLRWMVWLVIMIMVAIALYFGLGHAQRSAYRDAVRQAVEAGRMSPEEGRKYGVDAQPIRPPAP